jgi:hypothetical protein
MHCVDECLEGTDNDPISKAPTAKIMLISEGDLPEIFPLFAPGDGN